MNQLARLLTEILHGARIDRIDAVPNPALEKYLVIMVTLRDGTQKGIIVDSDSEGNGPGFLRMI